MREVISLERNETLKFFEDGIEIGWIHWGDHVDVPELTNYLEISDGSDTIVVEAEEFIGLLSSLSGDKPLTADLRRYVGCSDTRRRCGGPIEVLSGAFKWDLSATHILVLRNLRFTPSNFLALVQWLSKQRPWEQEYFRPFRLSAEERQYFHSCIELAARLAA